MPNRYDLRRKRPNRLPLSRFLIVCEGEKTERGYFSHLRHSYRVPVELVIEVGGTPKTLVEKAIALKLRAKIDARRFHDSTYLFDEVWCVFDIDEHPFVPEAKQQAKDNNINVAVSNPCFELWVVLHFQEQRAYLDRYAVQHLCRKYLTNYNKDLPCDELLTKQQMALQRASALEQWQRECGNAGGNPSTQVHCLVQQLLSLRKQT